MESLTAAGVEASDYGRTWLVFPSSGQLIVDKLYLYNGAHLALEPGTNPEAAGYRFQTEGFHGKGYVTDASKLGTIHVGPHQTFAVK